jgi:alcohol dehydrogenase class IV
MIAFQFSAPTQVYFGPGERHRVLALCANKDWGVLTSASLLHNELVAEIVSSLGSSAHVVSIVSANPKLSEIETAVSNASSQGLQNILAIGGGSVIDAAKVTRAALTLNRGPRELVASGLGAHGQKKGLLAAIPTAPGTGAEVSKGAIVTDNLTGRKSAVRGDLLVPDWCVVDPDFSASLPVAKAVEISFDVLAHATETYLSAAANPLTDILARKALDDVPGLLVRLKQGAAEAEAREQLAFFSLLMGYNLANASTCLPHRMQYPIGSVTNSSHQAGLIALYPAWLRLLEERGVRRVEEVGRRVSDSLSPTGVAVSDSASSAFLALFHATGLDLSLSDLGVAFHDADNLTSAVDGRIDLDPLNPSRADISRIYRESMVAS